MRQIGGPVGGTWQHARQPGARNYCSPRHIEQKPLKCAGRVVMGICDARREEEEAAESQILLVMAVDHIDPPVRKQVRRIVVYPACR